MAEELSKLGAELKLFDNRIEADGAGLHRPDGALYGHGDHRIVMALSVLPVSYTHLIMVFLQSTQNELLLSVHILRLR